MFTGFDVFILGEFETFFFIVSISIYVVIVVVHFAAAAATLSFLCQDLYTALNNLVTFVLVVELKCNLAHSHIHFMASASLAKQVTMTYDQMF
ncbi:hypothetical protein CARUB_v10022388mg [Capsella rubella]|uniref:Uncharacterized protein n=1 Tax=Capsella rubella TaxID=81985 RepID=R0I9L2_9BRAS|nr:hypothetical protein CARUB_v10022388mg [Capsella rubella]